MAHGYIIYDRSNTTFSSHIWILSKLLVMEYPFDDLLSYVIATSHVKILRRLRHSTLSMPYSSSLRAVTNFSFCEFHRLPTTAEMESDQSLLARSLPTVITRLRTKIPKIQEQMELAKANKPLQFYTKDTCMEFHLLLCELLERFEAALEQLSKSRSKTAHAVKGSPEFEKNLSAVIFYGYSLQRIARGSAIDKHLQNIQSLLNDHRRVQTMQEVDEMEEEDDVELSGVQPGATPKGSTPQPLWKSYKDWLRLILVHFDAVEILVAYVTGEHFHHNAIVFKILVSPPVDDAMLPWQTLFEDPTLFPAYTASLDHKASSILPQTNDQILAFLNDAISSDPEHALVSTQQVMKTVTKFQLGNATHRTNINQVIKNVEKLGQFKLPGWDEYTRRMLSHLEHLKNCSDSNEYQDLIRQITHALHSLQDIARFFIYLSKKQHFTGSLHCEACLATLLEFLPRDVMFDSLYDILSQPNVGCGVSIFTSIL